MRWVFFTLFLVNMGYVFVGWLGHGSNRFAVATTEPGVPSFRLRSEVAKIKIEGSDQKSASDVAAPDVVRKVEAPPKENVKPTKADEKIVDTKPAAPAAEPAALPDDKVESKALVAVAPENSAAKPEKESEGCFRFGPLFRIQDVGQLSQELVKTGAQVKSLEEDGQVPNKFWVYLPEKSSYEEAKKAASSLEEVGVVDIYILRAEPHINRISLGVYNDRAMADRRIRDLAKQRVTAQLELQYKPGRVFWVEVQTQDIHEQDPVISRFVQRFPGSALQQASCNR